MQYLSKLAFLAIITTLEKPKETELAALDVLSVTADDTWEVLSVTTFETWEGESGAFIPGH